MANFPKILNSTQPLLYETGYDEWPYSYAGSCFPVRWDAALYIVSAFHCYEKHHVAPEHTLYPIPSDRRNFFGFCNRLRGRVKEAKDLKHYDQIALEVSRNIHQAGDLESVFALDLSIKDSWISPSDTSLSDVWLRGFAFDNRAHAIDYEERKIRQQAYVTNGIVSSRKSIFDFAHMIKVKTPMPEGASPGGMSGSALYGQDQKGNVRFAGTVIEFNEYTNEYLVIDPIVLCGVLGKANA